MESRSAIEQQVVPAYSNTFLVFSIKGTLAMGNVLEESPSETTHAGTDVAAAEEVATPIINHSSVSIL